MTQSLCVPRLGLKTAGDRDVAQGEVKSFFLFLVLLETWDSGREIFTASFVQRPFFSLCCGLFINGGASDPFGANPPQTAVCGSAPAHEIRGESKTANPRPAGRKTRAWRTRMKRMRGTSESSCRLPTGFYQMTAHDDSPGFPPPTPCRTED